MDCEIRSENLHVIVGAANQSARAERLRGDGGPRGKGVQGFHVHHREFARKWIVKSALGDAAVQGHLAAFESRAPRIALAGLLPLIARARGLARAIRGARDSKAARCPCTAASP